MKQKAEGCFMTKTTDTEKMALDKNFSLRGESYKEGMLLLIKYLPEQDWRRGRNSFDTSQLNKRIEALYFNYLNALDESLTFKKKKQLFDGLLSKYEALLVEYTTLTDPFGSLRTAECYSAWLKGRETLETVGDDIILSETPHTGDELLRQEYEKVVSETPPLWFQWLPVWLQNLIKDKKRELADKPIPSSLRHVLGLANFSQHSLVINGVESLSYNRHATPVPVDLLKHVDLQKWGADAQEVFRITVLNTGVLLISSLDELLAEKKIGAEEEIKAVVLMQSLLSPGKPADFKSQYILDASDNDTQIYERKEEAVARFQLALANPKAEEHKAFLETHGLKVTDAGSLQYKGHTFKKITLLSTNRPYNILRRLGSYPEQTERNDLNMAKMLGAVSRYLRPLAEFEESLIAKPGDGFGLFIARSLAPQNAEFLNSLIAKFEHCESKGSVSEGDKKDLIKLFEKFGDDRTIKAVFNNKETARLLSALKSLLSIPAGQGSFELGDERHRQSLTSALEVIIVDCIGGWSCVACKSGKDRTGGASAAIDAAEVFYERYGRFPRFDDTPEDRALYLQIIKTLFESGHHQSVASQNAPGAEGLVNPSTFLPGDIELDADAMRTQTQFARLNKPKKSKLPEEVFNYPILQQELEEIKEKVLAKSKGNFLEDWRRNWEVYFISGISVKEWRGGKEFENEEDVIKFIEEKLLYKVEDKDLKKAYLERIRYAFHQGGFQHVFGHLFSKLQTQQNDADSHVEVIYVESKEGYQINFSPLANGIQVQEINTYDTKKTLQKDGDGDDKGIPPKHGGYYYRTDSSISVIASKDKSGYKLDAMVNKVDIDCADERLKPLFFRERNWLEIIIDFFISLLLKALQYKPPAKGKAQHETSLSAKMGGLRVEESPQKGSYNTQLIVLPTALKIPVAITLGMAMIEQFLAKVIAYCTSNLRIDFPLTMKAMTGRGAFFQLPTVTDEQFHETDAVIIPTVTVGA